METPYGQYPFYTGPILGGDVAFVPTMEHSPSMPLYRGETLYAFDKNTGESLWNITGYYQTGAIAEGNLILYNAYDGCIYNFGKGPSATTVSAPQTTITGGQSVMITGTVTDQSEGQKGTAAISDEDMSAWMEYLHMDHAFPSDATGVPVHITAIDPNGNYQDIGVATTDNNGNYGIMWTPPVPGVYRIVATFEGTQSYGSSSASTYMGVEAANPAAIVAETTSSPTTTSTSPASTITTTTTSATTPISQTTAPVQTNQPSPSQAVQPPSSNSLAVTYIAIVAVVVIIVAAAAVLILRRRK